MTGYRSGFAAGDPDLIGGAAATAPGGRGHPAGVRPAREHRRVGRRAPRRGEPGAVRGQARDLPRAVRAARRARRRQRGAPSTCGSRCPAAGRRSTGRSSCSTGRTWSSRPGRSSGRRARGTCGWRWCPTLEECERAAAALDRLFAGGVARDRRPRGARRAPRGRPPRPTPPPRSTSRRSRRRSTALDRGELRVAEPDGGRAVARATPGSSRRCCSTSACAAWRRPRSARSSTTTSCRSSAASPTRACGWCRRRRSGTARTSSPARC